jgi:AraC-like DNA-binding protein
MGAPEFSKLFKKSYGMTPGEAKQALNNGKQLKAVEEKAGSESRS